MPSDTPAITSRADLIEALQFAAELEQMLSCEYLFAGFSFRKTLADFSSPASESVRRLTLDRTRPWLNDIYMIARQEMEHLGIVTNLLAAVGAEPSLEHRRFPIPSGVALVGAPLTLGRFDEAALERFIWYERPAFLAQPFSTAPDEAVFHGTQTTQKHPAARMGISSIQQLYESISQAFQNLSPSEIFIGNTDRQFSLPPAYSVEMVTITNQAEAVTAIGEILEQGEGIGEDPESEDSHFQHFVAILDAYKSSKREIADFDPALPTVSNPALTAHPQGYPVTLITAPETLPVMHLFNDAYDLMLTMLKTLFTRYSAGLNPSPPLQPAMMYAAFFPLMTMVIRPLGEILTRLPAGPEHPGRTAGPSFEIGEKPVVQTNLGWYRDRLSHLAEAAKELLHDIPDRFREDITGLHQNLTSIRLHVERLR